MKLTFNFTPEPNVIYPVKLIIKTKTKTDVINLTSYKVGNEHLIKSRVMNRSKLKDIIEVELINRKI